VTPTRVPPPESTLAAFARRFATRKRGRCIGDDARAAEVAVTPTRVPPPESTFAAFARRFATRKRGRCTGGDDTLDAEIAP
jgi:hypothetical protein